jgi:hypothetical protein
MKKGFIFGLSGAALLIGLVLAGCGSAPASTVDLTGVTSYYVRADGNDKNAGISEDAPFKTLARAVEAAAKTTVKKITVIGTLSVGAAIQDADPTVRRQVKSIDATGGKDIAVVLKSQVVGVAKIDWSLDERDPDEILITGKPGATGAEQAVLTPAKEDTAVLLVSKSTVRLENIEISGLDSDGVAIMVVTGTLTLARGAKVTKNAGTGVRALGGIVIMRDDAEISGNTLKDAAGGGVFLSMGSVMVMFDKALVSGNKAENGSGGGVLVLGSSLLMHDNTAISGNSAGQNGGGISVLNDTENGYLGQVTISGNAMVSGNTTSKAGGGIASEGAAIILNDNVKITENTAQLGGGGVLGKANAEITMSDSTVVSGNTAQAGGGVMVSSSTLAIFDNATITGNTATEAGGGVVGIGDKPQLRWGEDLVITDLITGNTAPEDPDTNFTFN